MSQLAIDRQKAIQDHLESEGKAVISSLAKELDVSEMTIRRDLRQMEEQGLLRRVHGGAVPVQSARFDDRLEAHTTDKAKAVAKLASYVPQQGTIYLDGSTTMLHLVPRLHASQGLTVATNHIETFQRLAALPGVEGILIGGTLDRRTDNMVGALAIRSILHLAFDAAFFSAWGLSAEVGPMEVTLDDAEVKDLVASRSQSVYLAVNHQKLGTIAPGAWGAEPERATLATDLPPDTPALSSYRERFHHIL